MAIMVTDAVSCSYCHNIRPAGSSMLVGMQGIYCSPSCYVKGEEDETFDDEYDEPEDEDNDDED